MMVLALACPVIPVSASSVRLASPESEEFSSSSEEPGSLEGSRSVSVSPGLGSASSEETDSGTRGTHGRSGEN